MAAKHQAEENSAINHGHQAQTTEMYTNKSVLANFCFIYFFIIYYYFFIIIYIFIIFFSILIGSFINILRKNFCLDWNWTLTHTKQDSFCFKY